MNISMNVYVYIHITLRASAMITCNTAFSSIYVSYTSRACVRVGVCRYAATAAQKSTFSAQNADCANAKNRL